MRYFTFTINGTADRYDEGNPLNVETYGQAKAAVTRAGGVITSEGTHPDPPAPVIDIVALAELVENLPELRKLKDWKPRPARGVGER